MSFFSQNATVSNGGGEFETADAGMYVCRLKEIEVLQQPSFDDPNVLVDKFKWVFESTEVSDSNGNPYRFVKFTGRSFGNDKAALTILLDQMAGKRLTDDQFRALDLDALKRTSWNVMVDEGTNAKGYAINKVMSVRNAAKKGAVIDAPVKPAPKPKAVEVEPETDGIEDPFA